MKRATPAALGELDALLGKLRSLPGLVEKRGIYYHGSRSFLHFHEDPSGLYADVRAPHGDFARFQLVSKEDQAELLRTARDYLAR